jgi:simple sugar transport system permease protein
MGALSAFVTAYYTGSTWLAVLVAILVGGAMAAIHAFLTVTMRANQVVSGLSLTLFGSGLASFLGQRLGPPENNGYLVGLVGPKFSAITIPVLSDLPVWELSSDRIS